MCYKEVLAALRPKGCVLKEVPPELALKEGKGLTGPAEGQARAPQAGRTAGAKALGRRVGKGPTHGSPKGEGPDLTEPHGGCGQVGAIKG